MSEQTEVRKRARKPSDNEKASLRALRNWLFAGPCENPLEDQIVRLRLAFAIAAVSSGQQPKAPKRRPRAQAR